MPLAATPSTPPGHRPPPGLAATARAGRTGTEQSTSCHAVPDAWGASACPSEGRTRWIALAGGHSTPTKKGRQFLSPQTMCMGHTRATRHATPQRAANSAHGLALARRGAPKRWQGRCVTRPEHVRSPRGPQAEPFSPQQTVKCLSTYTKAEGRARPLASHQ